VIAITEDQCEPAPDWCARLLAAHDRPVSAVGGPVDRAPEASVGWAVYLADYGRYRPPLREGPTAALTDVNASYKRWALALVADVWRDEFHEPEVNGAILWGGGCLWMEPTAVVRQRRRLSAREALRDRYVFARLFASGRVRGAPAARRALLAATAPALPALLVARSSRAGLRSGSDLAAFLRALPAVVATATAWSAGELLGYLTGRPAGRRPAGPALSPGESV
jgi:hypothetical protein